MTTVYAIGMEVEHDHIKLFLSRVVYMSFRRFAMEYTARMESSMTEVAKMLSIPMVGDIAARMVNRSIDIVRALSPDVTSVRQGVDGIKHIVTDAAISVARFVEKRLTSAQGHNTVTTRAADQWRQGLNLVLSIAQFAAAAITFSSSFGDEIFYSGGRNPLIVPADYTFSIWGIIFPTSIVYGVYQALPRNREHPLLRRIGWYTAFAFFAITLWSPSTLLDPIRYTVPLFFCALWGLISALYYVSRTSRPLTLAERIFVALPVGVYAAWCTVGTIANTSTSLFALGYTDPFFSEQTWAVVMLFIGTAISAFMTVVSRANTAYALGIAWALVGIVVANIVEHPNSVVATTAGGMVIVIIGTWLSVQYGKNIFHHHR